MQDPDIANLRHLSAAIYARYNYDFRDYAMSSFKRRVARILEMKKLTTGNLLKKLEDTPAFINEFISELTVSVTEMFRDPGAWRLLRENVIPSIRRSRKHLKIWHAGCSSGEEVVAMCILLKEMGLLEYVSIVATDLDTSMLQKAKSATYATKNMEVNEKNYREFGGKSADLKRYYHETNGKAVFDPQLLSGVSYKKHDLVLDEPFSKFDLILCRNVMIYFNESLQNNVLRKFHESLFISGFLSIGSKESLVWCDHANCFKAINRDEKIYRKVKD